MLAAQEVRSGPCWTTFELLKPILIIWIGYTSPRVLHRGRSSASSMYTWEAALGVENQERRSRIPSDLLKRANSDQETFCCWVCWPKSEKRHAMDPLAYEGTLSPYRGGNEDLRFQSLFIEAGKAFSSLALSDRINGEKGGGKYGK